MYIYIIKILFIIQLNIINKDKDNKIKYGTQFTVTTEEELQRQKKQRKHNKHHTNATGSTNK